MISRWQDDPAALYDAGIDYSIRQLRDLIEGGAFDLTAFYNRHHTGRNRQRNARPSGKVQEPIEMHIV
ncbi:hypothetical protein H6B10_17070, partial [Gemmiger formicilis]|nr:hypothetical protein [Gemmiger formicilis]